MRNGIPLILLWLLVLAHGTQTLSAAIADPPGAPLDRRAGLIEVRKIWDKAPHNAFTDLLWHKGKWWCVFREGSAHVSDDGALRVIVSDDARDWQSAALLTSPDGDLRDAKICLAADGSLMLSGAVALRQPAPQKHRSLAWFSTDGSTWSKPSIIGEPNMWLWRVTWYEGTAYSIGYDTMAEQFIRLYTSNDGRKFDVLVPQLLGEGNPNETSIVFDPDGTAFCLLRRDGKPGSGLLGLSSSPYKNWSWKDLNVRIGGPHLLRLPDGRLIAAVRLYDKPVRTSLCWIDRTGRLTEFLKLPSGGDTSYAGLVWHGNLLWVSYYSSHEGKTSVYLAKVKLAEE